ncbi:PH domain-containing protein [Streptomyces sp. NPDC008141]|uniref:PH domain-containing protein n=1 Tax=Streptomyces sp. NPDC008141 TaxID=3364815 RepID=UPI0036E44B1E
MDPAPAGTILRLRLRRRAEWVPLAAIVLLVVWGIATASIVDGPNGTSGGIALAVVGVPVAVFAVSCAAHLVRPMRLTVDAGGLEVRLPLWPARTVPWSRITGVSAPPDHVVVDCAALVGGLPPTCRPRAAYRRLAADLGRPAGGQGLCFETRVFDLEAAELLDAIARHAPQGTPVRAGRS